MSPTAKEVIEIILVISFGLFMSTVGCAACHRATRWLDSDVASHVDGGAR